MGDASTLQICAVVVEFYSEREERLIFHTRPASFQIRKFTFKEILMAFADPLSICWLDKQTTQGRSGWQTNCCHLQVPMNGRRFDSFKPKSIWIWILHQVFPSQIFDEFKVDSFFQDGRVCHLPVRWRTKFEVISFNSFDGFCEAFKMIIMNSSVSLFSFIFFFIISRH